MILGHNYFSDWTNEEYKSLLTHKSRRNHAFPNQSSKSQQLHSLESDTDEEEEPTQVDDEVKLLKSSMDWRKEGAVGPP